MDLEQDEPASVSAFKAQLSRADAIVIATPEYNSSLPGVLKNALDWASRPYGASAMAGKPVAIVGAGAFDGTASAQAHLRLILSRFGVTALEQPKVYIAKSWEKFDEQGNLQDEATLHQLRALVDALLERIGEQVVAGKEAVSLSQ
jgi:chromate reductase